MLKPAFDETEKEFQRLKILDISKLKEQQKRRESIFFICGILSIATSLFLIFELTEHMTFIEVLAYPMAAIMSIIFLGGITQRICRKSKFWPFSKLSEKWQLLSEKKEQILYSFRDKDKQFALCHFFERLFEIAPHNNEHEAPYRESLLLDLKACFQNFNLYRAEHHTYNDFDTEEIIFTLERLERYYQALKSRMLPDSVIEIPDFDKEYAQFKSQYECEQHHEETIPQEEEISIGQTLINHSEIKKHL